MDPREDHRKRRAHLGLLVCLCFALQHLGGPLHLLWHEHVLGVHAAHGPDESPTVEDCRDEGHLPTPVVEHVETRAEPAVSPLRLDSSVHLCAPSGELVAVAPVETGSTDSSARSPRVPTRRARSGPRAPPFAS